MQHPQINGLISNVKKVLLKSPLRVQIYKEKLPDVPLPPEPVITRWGTWLNAATFLVNHYAGIKEVILGFDPGSSQAVRNCVGIFNDETIAGIHKSSFFMSSGCNHKTRIQETFSI